MLATKTANTSQELIEIIEGVVVAQGSAGTNTAGSPNFADLTAGAFADVLAGDSVYISGIATPFVVSSKTDDNNIVMTTNIATAHTADGVWRVKRGGIGLSALQWPPYRDTPVAGKWYVFYNTTTFGV